VESEPGEGSSFHFTARLGLADTGVPAQFRSHTEFAGLNPLASS